MGNLDQFNEKSLGEVEDLTGDGSYSAEYTWGGYASLYLVHADDAYDMMTLSSSSTTLTCGAYY